ncbi:DUF2514 domain-containing protein [Pseudomonas sp. GD04058]|uniref:DUF2514 domain-containing protein n=1 Tax=Pseudomonas sp. GD04058 TaxID=2975429 RepID=UPI002449A142|nr:DUF2514 domain-containing protein [Pseudomonas sp. GD04058]MDG9884091.1 DUF2514 domain-containing protein [Pseudomonas sp. GD04058]
MISARTAGAAATLLLVLASYWGAYQHGRSIERADWEKAWAARDAADSAARAQAEADAREEEQRRQAAQQEARAHAQKEQSAADIDAAGAGAAGQRLRNEASKLAGSVGCPGTDPAAVARGQAATRAAMVLSDLLKRSVATNTELAAAYDRARIAGLACEASYTGRIKLPR